MQSQFTWRVNEDRIKYSAVLELDLSTIEPTLAGPKRPQDKILLRYSKKYFSDCLDSLQEQKISPEKNQAVHDRGASLSHGSVVLAAITSCTNTSNPYVMIGAGLIARKARERGINVKPWVKTSLAPGSQVVTDYLVKAGLLEDLEALHFHLVGYGCTSCIGNSGPLPEHVSHDIDENKLVVASVLSGNRNFEARIHEQIKLNFLMSPMLVVAYALAGRVDLDMDREPLCYDSSGKPVFLKEIWPSNREIKDLMDQVLNPEAYARIYEGIFDGDEIWDDLIIPGGTLYDWSGESTYIREIPFLQNLTEKPDPLRDIHNARVLLMLGDSVTTDHISPAGMFDENSDSGLFLKSRGVKQVDFNTYGSRRGNDEVMVRGSFANVRIRNCLTPREGGFTRFLPSGEELTVFAASEKYRTANIPLIILAGKEYGSGSSRDWAAKGPRLLGVKAVIAESYERIHRSNLLGMGILPLQYRNGETASSLGLTGEEIFSVSGMKEAHFPMGEVVIIAKRENYEEKIPVTVRIDSKIEWEYFSHGGILPYVLRQFLSRADQENLS